MPPTESNELSEAARRLAPGESIQAQPWAFIALALALGAGVGVLVRYIGLRKALGLYFTVRKFV
jgi:hypothetical protein